jgi:hypothetical protein
MGSRLILPDIEIDPSAEADGTPRVPDRPTGTVPDVLRGVLAGSPVGRWWVPALTGELRAPLARPAQLKHDAAVRRHRTEDDTADPLIVPSEWGVF